MQKGASLLFGSREQRLELNVCCDRKSDEQRREGLSLVGGRVLSVAERRMRRLTVSGSVTMKKCETVLVSGPDWVSDRRAARVEQLAVAEVLR